MLDCPMLGSWKGDLGLDCFWGLFIGGITSLNEWYG